MNEFEMEDELYHHGVRGQKWGIRRYQNPDGSLTNAGRKKYGTKANFNRVQSAKNAYAKAHSKKNKLRDKQNARTEKEVNKYRKKLGVKSKEIDEKSLKTKPKSKSISEMSNEEIQAKIDRIKLENNLKQLTPQTKSKGKEFIKTMGNDVLLPVAKDVGKQYLTKVAKEYLGLDEKQEPKAKSKYDIAKDEADYWKNMNTISQQKAQYKKQHSHKSKKSK